MSGERLFRILGLVDEALIEEAAPASSPAAAQRRTPWRGILAAAACLTLVCGLGLLWGGGHLGGSSSSSGGSGHGDGTTFMSYAGPVFPLTLTEDTEGLTAEQRVTWDFAPGTFEDGTPRQWGATVTDNYVLVNHTTGDLTAVACYPFAGRLRELANALPAVTVDGAETEGTLYAGAYAGGFRDAGVDDGSTWNLNPPDSWTDYEALLEDGSYLEEALGEAPAPDLPVTVYEFTDFAAPAEYDAATQAIEFTVDQEKTTVFTYGFNGMSWDADTGWRQYSYFVPDGRRSDEDTKLLIVLGEDIRDYTLGGYVNGACEETLEGVSCTITRSEITLDVVLDRLCRDYMAILADWQLGMNSAETDAVPFSLFRRAVNELLVRYGVLAGDNVMDRYADGRLDDLISEALSQQRVLYLAVPVTIPAGGSAEITFSFRKEPSYDFYCSGSENAGLQGYDLVTALGSNLTFTGQTAALANTGGIEIVRQNLGFDPASGITEVTLDPAEPHYYLEVRTPEIP